MYNGKKPLAFIIPLYSTTVLYDYPSMSSACNFQKGLKCMLVCWRKLVYDPPILKNQCLISLFYDLKTETIRR